MSSKSSYSNISSVSKATSVSTGSSRRRGYVRPQGASFAPSAKNRESVMSLGSIAHLQYYFARTGLLEGRSGQMVRKKENGEYDIPKFTLRSSSETFESPIEDEGELLWEAAKEDGDEIMLPPTVSTYRDGSQYVPPPPSQQSLKRDLVDSLELALQALEASEKATRVEKEPTQGFHELQGLHILDTTTLAIRAARQYYTLHPNPQRLNSIKSDPQIRKELYDVLDVLKQAASRNFKDGLREEERLAILVWVSDVGMMIDKEARLEEAERKEKHHWVWMDDAKWTNREQEREFAFLDFLILEAGLSPEQSYDHLRQDFWSSMADGRNLIKMHNAAIKKSNRQFGYIDKCHDDVLKPYRRAENIRFWIKAAELRFELRLQLDVLATVSDMPEPEQMKQFGDVVLSWSKGVRAELVQDHNGEEEKKLHARARSLAMASPINSPSKSTRSKISSPLAEKNDSP